MHNLFKKIHGKPVIVEAIINSSLVPALVELGCTIYSVFSKEIVDRLKLPRINVSLKELRLAKESDETNQIIVNEICLAVVDLSGKQERIYSYVIEGLVHNLILDEPWMRFNDIVCRAPERTLFMEKD